MTKATVLAKGMEMIISGFISKADNNLVDFSWKKIKNANSERKVHEQNIETRIYQVTVDAINAFTFDTYKDQDILYIAVESILGGFKSKKDNIEAVKTGLKMLEAQITDDRCADFLGILCDEICRDENDILYKEIVLMQNEQISEGVHEGFKRSEQNQKDIRENIHKGFDISEQNHQEIQRKLDYLVEKADSKEANFYCEPVENRAEEYAVKWDKNVFLNDFKKRDKNAGVNVKLKDIYLEGQLPHYTWKTDNESLSDLKELLREYTVDNDGKNMLLILGQAGIGKSTLITWIMANFVEKKDDILVYQFATDLKNVDWQGDNIIRCIFQTLKIKYNELENRILILDGFDEIHTSRNRERILNKVNQELSEISILKNFSLVITCRENYLYELEKVECDYVTLQAWDEGQIKSFCKNYGEISKSNVSQGSLNKVLEKKEVFGVPLILYMVLALEISIEENSSIMDVYDQIFSLDKNSLYDRCVRNLRYGVEHRISKNKIKQQIHQVSQNIAFWIFENNSEKAFIPQKEYEHICYAVTNKNSDGIEDIKRDFLIGNYFKFIKHFDGIGTQELHFIHRTIYEYFVVVYFFESLHNQTSKEAAAGKLGELLKDGFLSEQILEFIKYRIFKSTKYDMSHVTKEIFHMMLKDGMTYYVKEKYKNIIVKEMNIFKNMLEVVHLWYISSGDLDNKIVCYLQHNYRTDLNLRYADLEEAHLSGTHLSRADLSGAYLCGADLFGADLSEANLSSANLSGANLSGANLSGANLSRACLIGACLNRTNLIGANLSGANLNEADLIEADLSGAYLSDGNLSDGYLGRIDLSGVNLFTANLIRVDLIETDGNRAVLNKEHSNVTYLNEADLSEAELNDTIFDEKQVSLLLEKCDLSKSKIFVFGTNEIISYKDYCSKKQNS